jgi:hypothetical protein
MGDRVWYLANAGFLEEAQLVFAAAHQKILGLLAVVQHHLVCLRPNAGLFVATKRSVRRLCVEAVGSHAACLRPGELCVSSYLFGSEVHWRIHARLTSLVGKCNHFVSDKLAVLSRMQFKVLR